MTNCPPRATPRHSNQPSSSTRPPDVYGNNRAHMHKITYEDGSEITIWHYRVAKQHERNQPKMSPHEMLFNIAATLHEAGNQFSIVHQQTATPVGVNDIEIDEDVSNYTSSCTTPKGDTSSTTLLICITNNYDNFQHNERPIDDLAIAMQGGKWHICPDRFCGQRSGMIGVFANVLPGGVNWSESAAKIAQELDCQAIVDEPMRVEVRPANFGYTDSTGKKTTTLVAVYAPVAVMFEVRGICSQLAYDTADKAGLGLPNSQFHPMKQIRSKTNTRDYILSCHTKVHIQLQHLHH